jgi:hypothetical protein
MFSDELEPSAIDRGVMRVRSLILIGLAAGLTACGDTSRDVSSETPWVTSVDSTSDTIVVRISGAIPEALNRTLVPELRIGSLDGAEESTFGNILDVRPAAGGGLIVYDQQVPAVRLFDAQGAFVRNISVKGGGPGEFGHLNGIASLPDGRLVLWDPAGSRLNIHAADGVFERSVRVSLGRMFGRRMLFSDAAGRIYAEAVIWRDSTDFSRTKSGLVVLDSAGTVLDTLPYPDWGDPPSVVKAATPDGGSTTTWYVPYIPATLAALDRSGGFVSGPSDPYRFYLKPGNGARVVRVEREHVPAAVSADERAYWTQQIETAMRRVEPAWRWNGPAIPQHKPAYDGIAVGLDGRIWINVNTVAEPIPQAELPPLANDQPPSARRTTRSRTMYDVYSPKGVLLGRVVLPWGTSISASRGDQVWGTATDSLDVPYAVRFRIEPGLPRSP